MDYLTQTMIKKFQREVEQYQEYIENKRILRWSKKTFKYSLRVYHPRWWYVQRFKDNFLKKHGFPYRKKKRKS